MICVPCMDKVDTPFFRSWSDMIRYSMIRKIDFDWTTSETSLVYDARNQLARTAIEEGYDRIMWIDTDMTFGPDLLERLSADLDEGREFVAALFFGRKRPIWPCVYSETGYKELEDKTFLPYAEKLKDYPRNQIFEVEAAGAGAFMVTTDLVKRIADRFGLPFSPFIGFGEDLSFCRRAKELGATLYCDSRIKVGHIGRVIIDEAYYDSVRLQQ